MDGKKLKFKNMKVRIEGSGLVNTLTGEVNVIFICPDCEHKDSPKIEYTGNKKPLYECKVCEKIWEFDSYLDIKIFATSYQKPKRAVNTFKK